MAEHGKSAYIPPAVVREDEHVGPALQDQADVSIKGISWFLVIMVAGILITAAVVYGQFKWLTARTDEMRPPPTLRASERPKAPPNPRLQESAAASMAEMRVNQDAKLESFGRIDDKHMRIPIERAMEIVVKSGWPKWPAAAASPTPTAQPNSISPPSGAAPAATPPTPTPTATSTRPSIGPAVPTNTTTPNSVPATSPLTGPSLISPGPTLPMPTASPTATGARP